MNNLKIGIIKEGKTPPDNRTPLIPKQCLEMMEKYPGLSIEVQSSPHRCYNDDEYRKFGIKIVDDISENDILLGIKEVQIKDLIPNKNYFFFSHTIKKQGYNQKLLRAVLDKKINLIDYETLTDEDNNRLIGFGRWAGIVGAHYALLMIGKRTKQFDLKPAIKCLNYQELIDQYDNIDFPSKKFVLTGGGRVASGAREIMDAAGILEVSKYDFLEMEFDEPVFTNLHSKDLYHLNGYSTFDESHFYSHPEEYKNSFLPFLKEADVLINCMFWSNKAPKLFEKTDISERTFRIKTISDISCDIDGSVPITFRESFIYDPIYGFDKFNSIEVSPYHQGCIDIMAVSNLPNELPRDASKDFGKILMETVIPAFSENPHSEMFEKATITRDGMLTERFSYLNDYANGSL